MEVGFGVCFFGEWVRWMYIYVCIGVEMEIGYSIVSYSIVLYAPRHIDGERG